MVKQIVLTIKDYTNKQELVREWLDDTSYHTLITEDTDLYLYDSCNPGGLLKYAKGNNCQTKDDCIRCVNSNPEKYILFKFRKNAFTQSEVESGYDGLADAAVPTDNRGNASGKINTRLHGNRVRATKQELSILDILINCKRITTETILQLESIFEVYKSEPEYTDKVYISNKVIINNFNFELWYFELISTIKSGQYEFTTIVDNCKLVKSYISKTIYANFVNSGVAGYYDRYPRIPFGRETAYTKNNYEKFKLSFPFLERLAQLFKELLPIRYANQLAACDKIDNKFIVPNTPFTTITVNKNFRTSAHYDPANMEQGFANLCVLSKNDNYSGGHLVLPEIGYAIDIRPRDLLLINNMQGLHGNTEIVLHEPDAERVSVIAFLHEGMLSLGTYEYEQARKEFVELRKNNSNIKGWNGVGTNSFGNIIEKDGNYECAREWYEFLLTKDNGKDWLEQYHKPILQYFTGTNYGI